MADARIVNELSCSESVFWNRLFLDDEFNRQLFLQELGFNGWKVVRQAEIEPEVFEREIEVMPKVSDIPGPLRSLIGEGLSYREIGRYDRRSHRYDVKAVSAKLGDRLQVEGTLTTEVIDADHCRRVFAVRVVAKVFGVGGLLEKRVLSDLEQNYSDSARFIGKYVKTLA